MPHRHCSSLFFSRAEVNLSAAPPQDFRAPASLKIHKDDADLPVALTNGLPLLNATKELY